MATVHQARVDAPAKPELGIFQNIPAEAYHSWPGASKSRLWSLKGRSPAHLKYEMENPTDPTPAMVLGSATHARILEPDTYADCVAVAPQVDRRTKIGKTAWADFVAQSDGKTIIKADEAATIEAMREAIMAHPEARKIIEAPGDIELSGRWVDPESECLCRLRADKRLTETPEPIIVDLKTTVDAGPYGFPWEMAKYGYHVQAAHYLSGMTMATGDVHAHFIIIAVEKTPPYVVAVWYVGALSIESGENELRPLLKTFAECVRTDTWPAYDDGYELDIPASKMNSADI